jgi:hypothetical protein
VLTFLYEPGSNLCQAACFSLKKESEVLRNFLIYIFIRRAKNSEYVSSEFMKGHLKVYHNIKKTRKWPSLCDQLCVGSHAFISKLYDSFRLNLILWPLVLNSGRSLILVLYLLPYLYRKLELNLCIFSKRAHRKKDLRLLKYKYLLKLKE